MANLTQTTLTGALNSNQTTLAVASTTGMQGLTPQLGAQKIYVINPASTRGELMTVFNVLNSTGLQVTRLDGSRQPFVSGAIVLIASADPTLGTFYEFDPVGGSMTPQESSSVQPWVNVTNGNQWLWSSVLNLWVPGWGNPNNGGVLGETAAVASAAGLITPSGPFFHITGTAAITGFNIPVGFMGGTSFTVVPDGIFTWTAANNIAVAGTAVVGRPLTFTHDPNTGKFYPSDIS